MKEKLTKAQERKLSKKLAEENFDIAQRYLKRYAGASIYAGVPFGEVKDRMQELVDKILEQI